MAVYTVPMCFHFIWKVQYLSHVHIHNLHTSLSKFSFNTLHIINQLAQKFMTGWAMDIAIRFPSCAYVFFL